MSNWYKFPMSSRMSDGDYRAGLNALNIVFGAVLGFVLVGGENLPIFDFTALLVISALIVMMIQSIALSDFTLFSVIVTAISIYFLPQLAEEWFSLTRVPKLQPTLAVWATMATILELSPREKSEAITD
jgi:cellulose synthase/poly-beta-1,6-N-acetylglucosamine synthase-like glycosyltransferase